ncbi:MAG: type IV secretory system conjugative DNA transfer family protein [Hoeflea sp.]|uniref:type IV secretory system conjugative DNA transfer family protein n=1 Tax=Hoeflea sp. TaxID=1940281 RepID=UPI0032EF6E6F
MAAFNEEHRFGSSRWANRHQIRRARLFERKGLPIGYFDGHPIFLDGDAPMITIGGAGSGKFRDLLGYVVCNAPGQNMVVLDPRGEANSVSRGVHGPNGDYAYSFNPMGIAGLPCHACNPLDVLDPSSPYFHSDCKAVAESLIPLSGSSNGQYFEIAARVWLAAILKHGIERHGAMSLPALYRIINLIESDGQAWAAILETMLASQFMEVRRVAGEMLAKQQDAPKEFGSIMGEIYTHLSFLDDPKLADALSRSDIDLRRFAESSPLYGTKLFVNCPAEFLSLWSPAIRLIFTVAMQIKSRAPAAPRLMLICDEAGQLGRFEALLKAFTYGRGAGVRAWAIFQDIGQIIRNYGQAGLSGYLGSSQLRQFFGARDIETARIISAMAGTQTLTFDDELAQGQARKLKRDLMQAVILEGADLAQAAHRIAQAESAANHRSKQARSLISADEVLNGLSEDEQIIFISGKDLPPIRANKFPYFTRREMAGRYHNNPYHPPADKVRVQGRFGPKWASIITEEAPAVLRYFPQHADGTWSYVKGYKPKL